MSKELLFNTPLEMMSQFAPGPLRLRLTDDADAARIADRDALKAADAIQMIDFPLARLDEALILARKNPGCRFNLHISGDETSQLADRLDELAELNLRLIIPDTDPQLKQALSIFAALRLGTLIDIRESGESAAESLLSCAELCLHSPYVEAPIEPFSGILSVLLGGLELDFFDLYHERPLVDRFITRDGRASISARWADKGEFLGAADAPAESWEQSALFRRIKNYQKELMIKGRECSFCEYFSFCRGYLNTFEGPHKCRDWKQTFDYLSSEALKLKADLDRVVRENSSRPGKDNSVIEHNHEATVFVSNTCPNHCLFCAPSEPGDKEKPPIIKGNIVRFIHASAAGGASKITFSGAGEPTLNPDLPELISLAKNLGIETISILTNGYKLTREKLDGYLQAGANSFLLSLHGLHDVHDRTVGRKGSFDEAVRALELLDAAEADLTVNTCITRYNLDRLRDIAAFVLRYETARHSIHFTEWSGRAMANPDCLCTYSETDRAVRKHFKGPARDKDEQRVVWKNLPLCVGGPDLLRLSYNGRMAYMDLKGEKRHERDLNIGNNLLPPECSKINCAFKDKCVGWDRRYYEINGAGEVLELGRAVNTGRMDS